GSFCVRLLAPGRGTGDLGARRGTRTGEAMARVKVTRRVHFCAAHRLGREDWDDARNRAVFGLCANPNWHGHNYEMDVTLEGEIDPETGYVLDLKTLRELVETRVIRDVDHRNLNLRSEEHTSELQSRENLVCRLLLEKKKN